MVLFDALANELALVELYLNGKHIQKHTSLWVFRRGFPHSRQPLFSLQCMRAHCQTATVYLLKIQFSPLISP